MSDVRCPPKNFSLEIAGAKRAKWYALIPSDHTVDDVLHPNYFGRIANTDKEKLRIRDVIELEWEDNTKFGELTIRMVSPSTEQLVTAVRRDIMEIGSPDLPAGWSMEFVNTQHLWAISFNGERREAGFGAPEAAAARANFLAKLEMQTSVAKPALKATPAKRKSDTQAPAEA